MKAIVLILALTALTYAQHGHGSQPSTEKPPIWLDTGLGNIDHPVTTKKRRGAKVF
jgi:hypothetical protein